MTGEREQFKEFIPQFRTLKSDLTYSEQEAFYQVIPEEVKPEDAVEGGQTRRMRFGGENNVVYINYQEDKRIEQREFLGKKFLISGKQEKFPWKMSGETKEVGDFLCHQATYQDSAEQVVAWFTSQIPVPLGPGKFGQLPGLILHVDVNDGERVITAIDLNFTEVDQSVIVEPKKGKEVSHEEFQKIVAEKMKEQGAQGRGGIFIHQRRNP